MTMQTKRREIMGSVPGETNNRDANMQVGRGGVDNGAKRCLWAFPIS